MIASLGVQIPPPGPLEGKIMELWMQLIYCNYFKRYSTKASILWIELVSNRISNNMCSYDKFHDMLVKYGTNKNWYLDKILQFRRTEKFIQGEGPSYNWAQHIILMNLEEFILRYLALFTVMEQGKYPGWQDAFDKWDGYFDRLSTDDQEKYSKLVRNFIKRYKIN